MSRESTKRIDTLDIFRGFAILMMMVYHFSYDLNYFHFISVHFSREIFWLTFRYTIVTIFLLSVGISLVLAHKDGISIRRLQKRALLLGGSSLLVTAVTYFQFPRTWVYFGILHFIFVASFLALPFISRPRLSLVVSLAIFGLSAMGYLNFYELFIYIKPILHLPRHTEDFLPIFPWLGVVLMGVTIGRYNISYDFIPHISANEWLKLPALLGRNALLVYLLHLPIIFGLVYLYAILVK